MAASTQSSTSVRPGDSSRNECRWTHLRKGPFTCRSTKASGESRSILADQGTARGPTARANSIVDPSASTGGAERMRMATGGGVMRAMLAERRWNWPTASREARTVKRWVNLILSGFTGAVAVPGSARQPLPAFRLPAAAAAYMIARDAARPGGPALDSRSDIAKAAGIIMLGNIISRLLGLVREQVIVALFGLKAATDVFTTASTVPTMAYD